MGTFQSACILFLLLLASLSLPQLALANVDPVTGFTCQGTSYANALANCPDSGSQRYSAGGNVTMHVRMANNLPNKDNSGPAAGVSDPYVKFTVGDIVAKSNYVRNNLYPEWDEQVNLGFLLSGTEVTVEIYDYDIGVERSDDLMVASSIRVPFCSTFNANTTTQYCDSVFGCSVTDSSWAMPTRQMCNESGIVSFSSGYNCNSANGVCLFLDILIIPFQSNVEVVNAPAAIVTTPQLGVAGDPSDGLWTTEYDFGNPFAYDTTTFLDLNIPESSTLIGALMYRMYGLEKSKGRANSINFWASFNFPATIYVCRSEADNDIAIPSWLTTSPWSSRNISVVKLRIAGTETYYGCFFRDSRGTTKNKWGGVKEGAVAFYTNTVPGSDTNMVTYQTSYDSNYIVLAVPYAYREPVMDLEIIYDMALFVESLLFYGLFWLWLAFLVARLLKKLNYRIDRIESFLSSHDMGGETNKSKLLASLFINYQQTPCNVEYRAHIFHATNALKFMIMLPNLLLLGWGFSCAATVRPPALGYGITFVGSASCFLWFGFKLWETSKWRLTNMSMICVASAIILFFCFIIAVIFVDKKVTDYGYALNFAAISIMFGTLNVIPLLSLVFKEDRTYRENLSKVLHRMTDAVYRYNNKDRKGKEKENYMESNKILHSLLGKCYTVNPKVPHYRFSSVLNDPIKEVIKDPDYEYEDDGFLGLDPLYNVSLFFLFVYMCIALARTDYPSLAFLNCLALLLSDQIISSVSRGDTKWTPGYKITLLVAGRLLIMGSTVSMWVLNYCLTYVVFASALTAEMIDHFLPMLSAREAGSVAFAGSGDDDKANYDFASTAHFNLGWLTFIFVAVMVVGAYGDLNSDLPSPDIDVIGVYWSVWSFSVLAITLVLCGGLIRATVRAFYLQKHGLLRGWARDGYMWRDYFDVPLMLAFATEIAIISTGCLMYAITDTPVLLVLAIFIPIIILCLGFAYREWIKNDYILVPWPPKDAEVSLDTHNPEDLEVAFHMIENLFGGEQQEEEEEEGPETDVPETKKLKGFKLPPLEASGNQVDDQIKMPPLPLKSVLRRKRQNMMIKTKSTSMKDMRQREGGDADKFGDEEEGGDVTEGLAVVDAWSAFMGDESKEEDYKKEKKKKEPPKYENKPRGGFMNHPYILHAKDFLNQYPIWVTISTKVGTCCKACSKTMKKWSKVKVSDDVEADDSDDEGKDDDEGPASEDLTKMPFWSAFASGYLSKHEYMVMFAWFGGMLAILIAGSAISDSTPPPYLGHVMWYAIWMFILTSVVIIKYFNTFINFYEDPTMKEIVYFCVFFHIIFTFAFFGTQLNGDIGLPGTLWLTDYFFYYPAFVYLFVEFIKWRELGYVILALDQDGDGDITIREYMEYFQAYPYLLVAMCILVWQFYLWIGYLFGNICLLLLLSAVGAYFFTRDWAINDFFLSPEMATIGNYVIKFILFVTFLTALFSESNPIFVISVFMVTLIFQQASSLFTYFMVVDPDTMVFFSPMVFPVYSYNPRTNDLVDETAFTKKFMNLLLVGAMWGAFLCSFLYPVNVGVFIACTFFMAIGVVISAALSYVPQQLGHYAPMISMDGILEAAEVARDRFADRRKALTIEMKDFEGDVDRHAFTKKDPTYVEKLQEKQSIDLAIDQISETRALTHVQDDEDYVASQTTQIVEDDGKSHWLRDIALDLWANAKKLIDLVPLPLGSMKGWKRHSESFFTPWDALAEMIVVGKGPFGWVGLDGYVFKGFKFAQDQPKLACLQQPWLNAYDEYGNNRNYVLLSEHIETKMTLARFLDYDQAIDFVAAEETRSAIHMLLLTMVSAEAKMQREQVLFQKFLRENRFRLASNGITPPTEIFTSNSFASIDIPLVAVWLSTLSSEQRERFHMLKASFAEEQADRDLQIDAADRKFSDDALQLEEARREREESVVQKMSKAMQKRQTDRMQAWADSLHPTERSTFNLRKEEWISNSDCYVHYKEQPLYDTFREACVSNEDDSVDYGRLELADLEACLRDSRLGEYGRSYQFVDSEFPPGDSSIGETGISSQVLGWRCAPGVVDEVNLFSNGSDPNDVNVGIFNDEWLLSAISMIAASGGGGADGEIVRGIANLFVGHYGVDGEITHNTEVGAFCLRIYKDGIWIPVVVDDLLPMLQRENWTNENRGLACAHAHECSSIWVQLIEKAFAKFYGNYAELSTGFVHHALTDLTGAQSECIPLAAASRGTGKRSLWDQIVNYQKNGFVMGVGTGSSALVDKEIMEMGITFNASYPIYHVWNIDGLKIVKLRNPPGHHDMWKGDWSLNSPMWTARLKFKLGWRSEDKDVLYMSFDDFCNVFRYLYVCKMYDPAKWTEIVVPGIWKKAIDDSDPAKAKAALAQELEGEDPETKKRMKAMSKIDTAGGLPSVDNPGCVIQNNPHYTLKIHRPTDVRIQVSQTDSRGKVSGVAHPFSIFICKNKHPTIPMRLESLEKHDIVAQCDEVNADRTRYLYASLKPGLYIVLIATYVHELEGTFTVKAVSNYRLQFDSVWPPRWVMGADKSADDLVKDMAVTARDELFANLKAQSKACLKVMRDLLGSSEEGDKKKGGDDGDGYSDDEDGDYDDDSD